jgi:hypothetical protein
MFTATRTKEVFALALVASTSVSQVSVTDAGQDSSKKTKILSVSSLSCHMIRAPTTRIFGDYSSEPMSTCALVYSVYCIYCIYCIKLLILWTASVNCIEKGWLVSKNQSTGMTTRIWWVYLPLFVMEASAATVQSIHRLRSMI